MLSHLIYFGISCRNDAVSTKYRSMDSHSMALNAEMRLDHMMRYMPIAHAI